MTRGFGVFRQAHSCTGAGRRRRGFNRGRPRSRKALMDDQTHMRAALALGRRALGSAWPNPAVGCVIVRDGVVVGRGMTGAGGRPHAETEALRMAGPAARGATAYVTLEPCSHWGKTPPCAEALIAAGLARVVVAAGDPDPRVNGAGIERLREAGIAVETGLLAEEATSDLAGFLSRIRLGRPAVSLKLASTLDGRIATRRGESRWITGPAARRRAHALRGQHDAIMVGVGTVIADDPDLTCRLPGYRRVPLVRVVADSHLRIPLTARLVATARETPTWVLHSEGCERERLQALGAAGVRCVAIGAAAAGVDLGQGLRALAEAGITRLLVEGGAQVAAALLRGDQVDRILWFHAPLIMGGDGWPAVQAFGVANMAAMLRFERVALHGVGEDVLGEYRKRD